MSERNGGNNMKTFGIRMGSIILILLLLIGCFAGCSSQNKFEEELVASWYAEGDTEPSFILYSDGSCEINNEYGTGTWTVVNDNQLKLTNFYGETQTATIVDITDGCLTLVGETGDSISYWNTSKQSSVSSDVTDEKENTYDNTEVKTTLKNLYISSCSDGVSWAKWEDEQGKDQHGLLNSEGEICFEVDNQFEHSGTGIFDGGPIANGYTYVQSDGNFLLLKSDGTITYQETNTADDKSYYILASGDGLFLVQESISNMTENVSKIGVMDASGQWKVKPISPESYITDEGFKQSGADGYQYCGEEVFSIDYASNGDNTHLFISASNEKVFEISEIGNITTFYNGELLCQSFDGGNSGGYFGKIQKITTDGDIIEFPVEGNLISSTEGHVVIAQEGQSNGYNQLFIYNMRGELEKDLSEYNAYDNYTPYFDNGYMTFLITGADGLLYIATIDSTTMDFLFEPIVIDNMFLTLYNNQAIVTLNDGNSVRMDLTTGEITKLPFKVPANSDNANVFEGIITLEEIENQGEKIYNWDGQEIVPTLK